MHKLLGGVEKRNREAVERLERGQECRLHPGVRATGVIVNALNGAAPACADCVRYGESHGYVVLTASAGSDSETAA